MGLKLAIEIKLEWNHPTLAHFEEIVGIQEIEL